MMFRMPAFAMRLYMVFVVSLFVLTVCNAFMSRKPSSRSLQQNHGTSLPMFDKIFEEEGPLGKGVTVGKVQVALLVDDRSPSSIFGLLERKAKADEDTPYALARMCYDVCMSLLRNEDDWISASSTSEWFKSGDAGKAERTFNSWADKEAAKFEKEYYPDNEDERGGTTTVVVSIIIEIQGDATEFQGAGFSRQGTKEVLSNIASDCMVEEGDNVNAVEVFWTPSDSKEVLSKTDMIIDFPELIDL